MNIKKTLLVSVAFAMVASVSFASKSNAEVDEAAGRYKAPKSYGWTTVAVGLATPVALPWGMEKWDVFGLDLNLGYSDAMKMYGWEIALGANVARKTFAGLQTAVGCLRTGSLALQHEQCRVLRSFHRCRRRLP